jgi:hypothetical protein
MAYQHPSLDKGTWTKEEDKLLLSLAQQHKGHNWEEIAKHMPVCMGCGWLAWLQSCVEYQCASRVMIFTRRATLYNVA